MKNKWTQIAFFMLPLFVVIYVLALLSPENTKSEWQPIIKYSAENSAAFSKNPPSLNSFVKINNEQSLKHEGSKSYHWFSIEIPESYDIEDPILVLSPYIITDIYLYADNDFTKPVAHHNRYDFSDNIIYSNQNKIFPLRKYDKSRHFHIKIEEIRDISINIELWEQEQFLVKDRKTHSFFSAILFGIFLMVVINSFFYLTIKDKAYLYYICYHSAMLILIFNISGFLYHYPSLHILGSGLGVGGIFLALTSFFFATFVKNFLNTKLLSPKINMGLVALQIIYAIFIILLLLFPNQAHSLVSLVNLVVASGIIFYTVIMIVHLKLKNRPAIFFTLAFSALIFVLIFRFLYVWDLVPQSFFTTYGAIVAVLIEAILFSIGLADRVLQLKLQRDNAELETAKTTFVYNLEKDFNRLISRINEHVHKTELANYKQYIVDQFFEEFRDKLGVNSNAVVFKTKGEITSIFDTRHENGYYYDIINANIDRISIIAKSNKPKILIGRKAQFLVVPVSVRDHEWSATILEVDDTYSENSAVKGFILDYSSELIRCLLNAQSLDEIKTKAEIDELTGLYNRGAIEAFINHELKKKYNPNKPVSIAFIDLDNFKGLNDQYGHQLGDECLKQLANTFRDNLPSAAQMGRFGGDEFIIMIPETNQFKALNIINRVKNKLQPLEYKNQLIPYSISVGISSQSKTHDSLKVLLEHADKALYESKDSGKNTISVA